MAKILIIEDDVNIRNLYRRIFTFERYEVEMAQNGLEGLEKAVLFLPNLILLDILMEGIDGIEALRRLKKDKRTKEIPVLMVTVVSDDTRIHQAFASGAAGYLVKSEYTPKQIVEQAKKLLEK